MPHFKKMVTVLIRTIKTDEREDMPPDELPLFRVKSCADMNLPPGTGVKVDFLESIPAYERVVSPDVPSASEPHSAL